MPPQSEAERAERNKQVVLQLFAQLQHDKRSFDVLQSVCWQWQRGEITSAELLQRVLLGDLSLLGHSSSSEQTLLELCALVKDQQRYFDLLAARDALMHTSSVGSHTNASCETHTDAAAHNNVVQQASEHAKPQRAAVGRRRRRKEYEQ